MLLLLYYLYLCKKAYVKNVTILLLSMCYLITEKSLIYLFLSYSISNIQIMLICVKANKCYLNYQYVTQVNVTIFKLLKEEHI